MDSQLRLLSPGATEIETRKDEYSEDYIVWVTVNEELHSIRITTEEYREGFWIPNVLRAIAELSDA